MEKTKTQWNLFEEWMFLDSGNIISDDTFCAQSNYGGKVPEFSAESLCLSCHPLTKAERFFQKFGKFSIIIWLCVRRMWMCHQKTVKPVLGVHCHERRPVLKDHIFLAAHPHFNAAGPVINDHWSCEAIFLWPLGRSFKKCSTVRMWTKHYIWYQLI